MILPLQETIRSAVIDAIASIYGLAPDKMPSVAMDYPPNRGLGDLATPVAFELARKVRKAPRAIATELASRLTGRVPARVEPAPNGYLNFFLERAGFLIERVTRSGSSAGPGSEQLKTIVEHTAINPNKAAHVGHLRNAALGDTLVRALRFQGVPVEVQNYIDDTGVQVADVVVGFHALESATLDTVRQLAAQPRFDYYCWDLYARVTEWYEADESRQSLRVSALHDIEQGGNHSAEMAALIADRIVRCHLRTLARMNVDYQLLTCESDILHLRFWARAFEILKESGTVFLQTEGKLAGCWVMRIEDEGTQEEESEVSGEESDNREKVIVRSNGIVTYVGKDIAYQFWKFGLLGRDFNYRRFEQRHDGSWIWATSTNRTDDPDVPSFGRANSVYNVIDVRQSYLQKLLRQALATLGYADQAQHSTHFSYEMVALSQQTARRLGYLSDDTPQKTKGFVEVSGRKGQGVKADDLLDLLTNEAQREVSSRNSELGAPDVDRIARMIAVAAVRYFMIKFSRTKVIAFDIDEALNFEGESGPYLQYAVVRANNIFNKLRERDGLTEADVLRTLPSTASSEIDGAGDGHALWALVLEASRLDEIVDQVVRTLEFSVLAKFAFGLAQAFNAYYHRFPILNEEEAERREWRAAGVLYVRNQLASALGLMGIDVPPRM
jgi:arginyl-tRNA synthetase